jgi:hypothetical protein
MAATSFTQAQLDFLSMIVILHDDVSNDYVNSWSYVTKALYSDGGYVNQTQRSMLNEVRAEYIKWKNRQND